MKPKTTTKRTVKLKFDSVNSLLPNQKGIILITSNCDNGDIFII